MWSTRADRAPRPSTPSPAWARRWPTPTSCADSTWWASIRAASATRRRNCAAAPTPSSTRSVAIRWPTTAPQASPTSKRSTASSPMRAPSRMGTEFLANVGTASSARDMDVVRAALGENQINYLGFSYGTELGAAYAEQYPDRVRAMVLDGAVDPSLDPIAGSIRQMAGFQTAFNDYAADCAQSAGCPLGTDPAKFVRPLSRAGRPAGEQAGRDVGSAWPELPGRDNRHRQRALHPALLAVPHQRAAGPAARHRRRRPAAAGRRLPAPRRIGSLQEPAGRVHRDSMCRRAVPDRPCRVGRRRSADPRGRAVHGVRHLHRVRPARHVRDVAGAADVDSASSHLTRPRQGRRRLHHARPGHPVCRRASIWPVRWAPR